METGKRHSFGKTRGSRSSEIVIQGTIAVNRELICRLGDRKQGPNSWLHGDFFDVNELESAVGDRLQFRSGLGRVGRTGRRQEALARNIQ